MTGLLETLMAQQQPDQKKPGGMRPEVALALSGIGQGMSQLGAMQPVNMGSAMQQAMQMRGGNQNVMQQIMADPMKRAALAKMPPQMAERILMQAMFGIDFGNGPGPTEGIQVGDNLVNPITGDVIYEGPKDPIKPNFDFIEGVGMVDMNNPPPDMMAGAYKAPSQLDVKGEGDLRKEFSGLQPVKEFQKQSQAFGRIVASAKEPSAAGDLALIFNYMKLLDPGSVVRESEFATASNAAGVPDRIRNMYNRVLSGERLADEQRRDFVSRASELYVIAEQQHEGLAAQYGQSAETYGYDPARTIPDFRFKSQGAPPISERPQMSPRTAPMARPSAPTLRVLSDEDLLKKYGLQ